jgi:hypothetical protein
MGSALNDHLAADLLCGRKTDFFYVGKLRTIFRLAITKCQTFPDLLPAYFQRIRKSMAVDRPLAILPGCIGFLDPLQ